MEKAFFGIYRGVVVNNDDSEEEIPFLGRVKIRIPTVYGEVEDEAVLPWAWPCNNFPSGPKFEGEEDKIQYGQVSIPPIGSTVWVMFEEGNPLSPVYIGSWFNNDEAMPEEARVATNEYDGEEAQYPRVMIIKCPWRKDVYLRFNDNKSFEIVYGQDIIKMKAPSKDDGDDGEVYVKTKKSSINLWIEDEDVGKISLRAQDIEIWARKNFALYIGEWEASESGKNPEVKTEADGIIMCSKDLQIHAEESGKQTAGKDNGEWTMGSPKTSGYEKHGD